MVDGSAGAWCWCQGAFWWHPAPSSEQQAAWAGYMHRLAAADTGPVPAISTPQGDRGYYAQGDRSSGANIIQGDPQISLTGWQSIICKQHTG